MKKATSTLSLLATLILAPFYPAHAQKQALTPRLAFCLLGAAPNPNLDVFIQELRNLGHIEGKNILIE